MTLVSSVRLKLTIIISSFFTLLLYKSKLVTLALHWLRHHIFVLIYYSIKKYLHFAKQIYFFTKSQENKKISTASTLCVHVSASVTVLNLK